MSVYDKLGNKLNEVFDIDGLELSHAYDIDGNEVLNKTPTAPTDLTVMTYNIGQWYTGNNANVPTANYEQYYNLQRSIIFAYNPDIASFQEYYDPFSSGHTVDDVIGEYFTDHKNNATSGYKAKAIYSNGYELSDYSETNFAVGNSRSYIKTSIQCEGRTIWLINAHLETSTYESAKVAESTELLNAVANLEYFIIMADFNTVCKSVNDEEYTTIMKQFIDAGYHSANCSEQHGFIDTWTSGSSASGTWYPCDQIITSANIDINNVVADQTKVTDDIANAIDHIPLIAYVTVN